MLHAGITRHHVDVQGRDVHYLRSGDGLPVVLLHASPRSSAALLPLMAMAPAGVALFAFDTPGCGDSEPIRLPDPDAGDYADALADTLAALGITTAAVYGTHTGAAIAMALAVRHPRRVSALVLDGLSVFDAAERAELLGDYLPPFLPRIDGTHLAWLWSRVRDQHLFFPWHQRRSSTRLWRPLPTTEQIHAGALDLLRAGDHYRAPYRAAIRYAPPEWLAQLAMPVFIGARADDVLLTHLARLPAQSARVRIETLPADIGAWGERVWSELLRHGASADAAPHAAVDTLPHGHLGSAFIGPAGTRIHLRGALGGRGRPLVLLHDSPGSARGFDARMRGALADRPVLAPDLPAHGDSDEWQGPLGAMPLARAIHAAMESVGLEAADIEGVGASSAVAAALARLAPTRYAAGPATFPVAEAMPTPSFTPRAEGGHLQAAWLHARDVAILGPAWARCAAARHDFGEVLDEAAIHGLCVAALKEAPGAAKLRAGLWRELRSATRRRRA